MGYAFFISTQNMKHEIQDNTPYCPTILGEQTQQAEGIKTNTPHLTPQLKRILMSHITGLSTAQLLAEPNLQLTEEQQKWFNNAVERLQNNEPLQHILGYTTFYGRQFKCDRRALIPRPETEELIDWIINDWSTINNQQPTVNKQQTLNSQLSILNSQFSILNSQFSILNSLSAFKICLLPGGPCNFSTLKPAANIALRTSPFAQ